LLFSKFRKQLIDASVIIYEVKVADELENQPVKRNELTCIFGPNLNERFMNHLGFIRVKTKLLYCVPPVYHWVCNVVTL